jgi:hypothetical protein
MVGDSVRRDDLVGQEARGCLQNLLATFTWYHRDMGRVDIDDLTRCSCTIDS